MSKFYDMSRGEGGVGGDGRGQTQRDAGGAGNFFLKKKLEHKGGGVGLTKNLSLNVGK